MRWIACLLACTGTVPCVAAADWIKISSANFELLTDGAESEARKTLATFEQARDFFLRERPPFVVSRSKARIVGFNGIKEYKPYSPTVAALAHFVPYNPIDYIVLSDLELERMRVAIHEYVHLLVSHSGLSIPLWLNEGMADVYATLQEEDGKLALGAMQHDRTLALGSGNWIRLPALLAVNRTSTQYHQTSLAVMFYAQSCLLAHMLMLGDGYADKFPRFLDRISATGSSQSAFSEVYGKTTAEIEKEMNAYFRQRVQNGAVYRAVSAKVEIGPSRPATGAEVGITLANLTASVGRTAEAKDRLKQLSAEFPRNAEIEMGRGRLEEASGDKQAALAHYRDAAAVGTYEASWDYARLLDDIGGQLEPRIQALELVLQRKPDLTDARLRLGRLLCVAGRFSDASALLQDAGKIEPEKAAARFLVLTVASLGLNQRAEARQYAEEARNAARMPDEKASAEKLLAQIRQATSDGPLLAVPTSPDPDFERPVLRRGRPTPKKP